MIAELGAIQSAAGSLKAAGDIVKAMIGMKVTAEVQAKIIELQTAIMSAQSGAMSAQLAQTELLERVRGLEADLKRFEKWEAEKQRYQLKQFEPACVVYSLKQELVQPSEPEHLICPNCYERQRKSILQWTGKTELRRRLFVCPNRDCRAEFMMGQPASMPAPQFQPNYSVFGED